MTEKDPTTTTRHVDQEQPGDAPRPLRVDARRNRARLLEVAAAVFAAEGLAVPIDEIARRAGVGPGTVYRHFPNKDALFEAVIHDRVERLIEEARVRADAEDPGAAFFEFFTHMVRASTVNKGLADALAGGGVDVRTLVARPDQELREALAVLLTRAQQAGAVRADVDVADVKALTNGCQAMERDRAESGRMLAVVLDGLRPRA